MLHEEHFTAKDLSRFLTQSAPVLSFPGSMRESSSFVFLRRTDDELENHGACNSHILFCFCRNGHMTAQFGNMLAGTDKVTARDSTHLLSGDQE